MNKQLHKLILVVLLFGLAMHAWSQTNNVNRAYDRMQNDKKLLRDSLLNLINKTSQDTTKLRLYNHLCEEVEEEEDAKAMLQLSKNILARTKNELERNTSLKWQGESYCWLLHHEGPNTKNTQLYLEKGLSIFKGIKDAEGIKKVLIYKANVYFNKGDVVNQLNCLKEGLELMETMGSKTGVSRFLVKLQFFYADMGDTSQALYYLDKALSLEKEIGDKKRAGKASFLTGAFYARILRHHKAIEFYKKAIPLYRVNKEEFYVPEAYLKMGEAYQALNNYQDALKCYDLCSQTAESTNGITHMLFALIAKGKLYAQLKEFNQAIRFHEQVLKIGQQTKAKDVTAFAEMLLANDYFEKGDFKSAKSYIDKALPIYYENAAAASDILKLEITKYRTDSALKDYSSAFYHFHKFLALNTKLNNEEVKKIADREKFQNALEKQKLASQAEQDKKEAISNEEKKKQRLVIYATSSGLFLVLLLVFFIFRSYRQKQEDNRVLQSKNELIAEQKHLVEEKQKEILDSITYAKRLQEAILPPREFVNRYLPNNFILYTPKDIVAGDFYWAESVGDNFYIAAADSTGHGVPGAMVSVVCSTALSRSLKEFKETETGKILDKTRELVIETFEKSTSEVKDGMDISLLCINHTKQTVTWSGANNPLWYVHNNELREIKADKQPIGKTEQAKPFTIHELPYLLNTTFYLFTDGLADQFGGPNGKKFKYKQFSDLLVSIVSLSQAEQREIISKKFEEWRGKLEQVDDVCVIGICI